MYVSRGTVAGLTYDQLSLLPALPWSQQDAVAAWVAEAAQPDDETFDMLTMTPSEFVSARSVAAFV